MPCILILIFCSLVWSEVDTSLIQVGNQWEYSQRYERFPGPSVAGKLFITILSKKRSADSLAFEMKLRDSLWNLNEAFIRDSTYKYIIANGNLLIDTTRDGLRRFSVTKPLFFYGGESGGSTSTITYKNDTLHLTRGTGDTSFAQGAIASYGSYLEKVGMIDMRTWQGGGMTSERDYFTLLKFNNENVDTSYIFSKEAVPLIRHERISKSIRLEANSLIFSNGKKYRADGKPAFTGFHSPAGMAGSRPPGP